MDDNDKKNLADDEQLLDQYAEKTRRSLIERLENWQDQQTWDEFYRTYWRLIYSVAIKMGLRQDEAWDVVQETTLSIAKQTKKKMYDPEQGSFKVWLWNMTKWRIQDQFRKRKKDSAMHPDSMHDDDSREDWVQRIADENNSQALENIWDAEWKKNLFNAALENIKLKVSPRQFQIFDCYVLKEWDARKVMEHLGVSLTQVYLAKHRVGAALKKELKTLARQQENL